MYKVRTVMSDLVGSCIQQGLLIEIKGCTTNDENSTSTGATIDAGGQPMAIRHGVNVGCDAFLSQDQSWA